MRILFYIILATSFIYPQQKISATEEFPFPGIKYKEIINFEDTLIINVLAVDMSGDEYELLAVNATDSLTGRETVSSMIKRFGSRYDVLAGINSDFFKIQVGGEPENNLVSDGEVIKALRGSDSDYNSAGTANYQFGVNYNDRFFIERFSFDGKLVYKDQEFPLNRINSVTDSGGITLYNNYQGTVPGSVINSEIRLDPLNTKGDTLLLIVKPENDSSGGYILSFNNNSVEQAASGMLPGDTLKAIIKFKPYSGSIKNLTGGWGKIVDKGKNIAMSVDSVEGTFPRFSAGRHPRSGIGISEDSTTVFLITVDGRQEKSKGVSLYEFADIMLREGIYSGLNLDGGGSTTLVLNGKIVNNPSDKTGERPVGCALLLVRKRTVTE